MYSQPTYGRGGDGRPPRRRHFRGQYVRRRTPSGGGYRAGSFSDDRNDSSPPPPSMSQQQSSVAPPASAPPVSSLNHHHNSRPDDDQPPPPPSSSGQSNYYHQQQTRMHQQPRIQHRSQAPRHQAQRSHQQHRGPRHDARNQQQFYDSASNNQPSQNMPSSRDYDYSENEYDAGGQHYDAPQQQQQPQPPQQPHHMHQHSTGDMPNSNRKVDELFKSFQGQKTDIDEMRAMFSKLTTELDQVRSQVRELQSTVSKSNNQQHQQPPQQHHQSAPATSKEGGDWAEQIEKDKRKKSKLIKQREKKAAKLAEKRATISENASQLDRSQQKILNQEQASSTTQAAEPSSEDRPEGDDAREGNSKVRVLRKKKPHFARRGAYGNRRRRADSSERNSNDTSPQNEANGTGNYQEKRKKRINKFKAFPELSETELSEIVEALKHDFLNSDRPVKGVKEAINEKGPKVAFRFAVSILDHAILDVTNPATLNEIATNLHQLIVHEDNTIKVDFQKGFYDALEDISKRENDIMIDAPRFLDMLGQVLADCIVPMSNKNRPLIRRFLNKSVKAYGQPNKATFLASIMRSLASIKDPRFAKEIWDIASLKWDNVLNEGIDLNEFLESHDVKFTTQIFSPEPRKPKVASKELEKFADDVTNLVEKHCAPDALNDLVKESKIEPEEQVDYLGTLAYAIVRGCINVDSGSYTLNDEGVIKYSSILNAKNEKQDAIVSHALVALTKLWQQYNCPQDLLRNIFKVLYNNGTAPYEALKSWLESENLKNVPGIGAARLSCKRYIQDLGTNHKS